jgi:hypothetical protein
MWLLADAVANLQYMVVLLVATATVAAQPQPQPQPATGNLKRAELFFVVQYVHLKSKAESLHHN